VQDDAGYTKSRDPHVYRASDDFVAAYRAFRKRYAEVHLALCDYNVANPAHPLVALRHHDQSISVCGIEDVHPDQDPPEGLSRSQRRRYLLPRRGEIGAGWRALIKDHDRYPNVEKEVFEPLGVSSYLLDLEAQRSWMAGVYDYGEHGVFVRISVPYAEPLEHLTKVPLSEFYLAREAHTAETKSQGE
jgi:hypothetical protein